MPVWPSCFCSCWPIPALAAIRLPAPIIPTSFMVTPPSVSAPSTASEARSTMSLSGCFPNLVMWIPRIQTSSAAISTSQGFEAEADRFGSILILPDCLGGQAHRHPERDVLGIGFDIDQVRPHTGALAVDQGGDVGNRHPRRGERHDGEGLHLTGGRDVDLLELGLAAAGTAVPAVEEACAATRAFVRLQMGLGVEHQVVDERDLLGHRHHSPIGPLQCCGATVAGATCTCYSRATRSSPILGEWSLPERWPWSPARRRGSGGRWHGPLRRVVHRSWSPTWTSMAGPRRSNRWPRPAAPLCSSGPTCVSSARSRECWTRRRNTSAGSTSSATTRASSAG